MPYDKEARSLLHAVINLFLLPFQRHVEVLASENTDIMGRGKQFTEGKGKQ
jgi:hypothetical protein